MVNHVHETSIILAVFLIQESAAVAVAVVVVGFHAVGSLFHQVLIWSCCLKVSQNLEQLVQHLWVSLVQLESSLSP